MFCLANVSVDLSGILYLYCNNLMLSMLISEDQAFSIWLALNNKSYKRPLTHDLLVSIARKYNITFTNVTIYKEENGVYYAFVCTKDFCFDSRPSDAVAIALRLKIPIYVNIHLMKKEEKSLIKDKF